MFIKILSRADYYRASSSNSLILTSRGWNDYGFYAMYDAVYIDEDVTRHDLVSIRIGCIGQDLHEVMLNAGESFDKLPENFFSLGISAKYYEQLNKIGYKIRDRILFSLNDIAKYSEIYDRVKGEQVTIKSLMRGITETEINGQLRRMANGGAKLISYNFQFESPAFLGSTSNYLLSFQVEPESKPPTNINVLIGRNAAGKTTVFNAMVRAIVLEDENSMVNGKFVSDQYLENGKIFANSILVSFSAFDEAGLYHYNRNSPLSIPYTYIGLKKYVDTTNAIIGLKTPSELTNEFVNSLLLCRKKLKQQDWIEILTVLESDPNFKEENFSDLINIRIDEDEPNQFKEAASSRFSKLSSGHKIILLTVTRLVETLEEKSLLLIDEPETHLHPPLLSSFITAISKLLGTKNGVAIIATHSPVVLQEVPNKCIWKLRRSGSEVISERLLIESYGENVGVLTQEVFGLEVTESGFHKLLKNLVDETDSYESAIFKLGNQVGLEAKSILRSMFYEKNNSK